MKKYYKKITLFMAALALCGSALVACNDDTPTKPSPDDGNNEPGNPVAMTFEFDVKTLSPNSAEVVITPSDDNQTWYWTRATDKEFEKQGRNKDAMLKTMLQEDVDYGMNEEGWDLPNAVADVSHKGQFANTLQSLFGSTTYHLFAAAIDKEGKVLSEVAQYTFESKKCPVSLNTFSIEIPESTVSFASARISIQPSNNDPYTWFVSPSNQGTAEQLAESFIEQNGLLLNTGYYYIYTGTQTQTMAGLDPDLDYTVVVFGYQAGRTTGIESSTFRTQPAGDPAQTTFEFEVNPAKLTARGAEIAVTPSDPSTLYWYELLPAALFEQYGSAEETVKTYMQEVFDRHREEGYSIEEIVRGYCTRGPVTMSFGPDSEAGLLTPNTEYRPFAVCMNFDGTMAGEVFTGDKFTTPEAVVSSATATAICRAHYDCDEYIDLYPGELDYLAGKNLLILNMAISHSQDATHWYFMALSADYTDPTKYSDEELLAVILGNVESGATIMDETNTLIIFPADTAGTFLTIAEDKDGNFGKLVRTKAGPYSVAGATPVPFSASAVPMNCSSFRTGLSEFCPAVRQSAAWPDYLKQRDLGRMLEQR